MHNVESLPCTRDLCVGLVIFFCQLCSELCEPSLSQSEAEEKAVEFESQEGRQAHQSMWPCSQISKLKLSVGDLYVTVAGAVHRLVQCTFGRGTCIALVLHVIKA